MDWTPEFVDGELARCKAAKASVLAGESTAHYMAVARTTYPLALAELRRLQGEVARLTAAVRARDGHNVTGNQTAFGAVRTCSYCERGASSGDVPHRPDCPILTHPLLSPAEVSSLLKWAAAVHAKTGEQSELIDELRHMQARRVDDRQAPPLEVKP